MARNDGIDRTFARNQDLPTLDDVAKVQEHNEREKDSYHPGIDGTWIRNPPSVVGWRVLHLMIYLLCAVAKFSVVFCQ